MPIIILSHFCLIMPVFLAPLLMFFPSLPLHAHALTSRLPNLPTPILTRFPSLRPHAHADTLSLLPLFMPILVLFHPDLAITLTPTR